jgi:hypothetical protein
MTFMSILSSRLQRGSAVTGLLAASIALAAGPAGAAATVAAAGTVPAALQGLTAPGVEGSSVPGGFANTTSTNWSGYAANTATYTSVSASWIQPAVKCTKTSEAVFWVGLDGWGSDTVEQDGSGAYCSGTTAQYYAWWETYPANSIQSYNKTVKAGDHFTATVTYQGGSKYLMTVVDSTQGWTETTHATAASATRTSAEVIAEAPSGGSGRLALADFAKVAFTGSMVDGSAISSSSPTGINMKSSSLDASTSALTSGTNFTVTWKNYS